MTGIYIASKTAHAAKWKHMRSDGLPIISTWIDEAGVGESQCLIDLWRRCINESCMCDALIVYREPGEILKGALIEVGAALACGVHVFAVGCGEFTFVNHPLVTQCADLSEAIAKASAVVSEWENG